jgi:hypothetical protein
MIPDRSACDGISVSTYQIPKGFGFGEQPTTLSTASISQLGTGVSEEKIQTDRNHTAHPPGQLRPDFSRLKLEIQVETQGNAHRSPAIKLSIDAPTHFAHFLSKAYP